ncbi:MAG: response regulator transcription factor [Actinomycetia bacterium]|nr:response regulator transcription factor [Actinomycetes bacterium]MCP4228121.1 response regulator transcription factor [Actinomycetes bacterium]MCP5032901.1 response regulator transcription factor [Actinomycetes bacterium]
MRILIVEDNDAMIDALERGLIAEGFDIDVSRHGSDGLWRAREFPYDAIVLDIMLPGVNGYEICRTLRSEDISVPVLMLTAKSGEYDIAEGLDLGADDYLTKPFSFVVLVARLRALIRRTSASTDDTLRAGELSIDTVTRRCWLAQESLELTPREYSLLETLTRHVDEPLTRGELRDRVWGGDHDTLSNVVDVYVGYLRRKLDPERVRIDTVRGVGYRLVAP